MKPLVLLDLETTGPDRLGGDWIVQFSSIKVDREHNKIIDSINEYIRPDGNYTMSLSAYLKHHIHPDFLKDKPTFKELAPKILGYIGDCDILTYNGYTFDLPFLNKEFKKAGIEWLPSNHICYDSYLIEKRRTSNQLGDVFKRYCGRTMEEAGLQPHDALSDVKALYAVFRHQVETGPAEPETLVTDDGYFAIGDYDGKEMVLMNFGKYSRIPLDIIAVADKPYLLWVLTIDICEKSKRLINEALEKTKQQ